MPIAPARPSGASIPTFATTLIPHSIICGHTRHRLDRCNPYPYRSPPIPTSQPAPAMDPSSSSSCDDQVSSLGPQSEVSLHPGSTDNGSSPSQDPPVLPTTSVSGDLHATDTQFRNQVGQEDDPLPDHVSLSHSSSSQSLQRTSEHFISSSLPESIPESPTPTQDLETLTLSSTRNSAADLNDLDENSETPRLMPGVSHDNLNHSNLPHPGMAAGSSLSDADKRLSMSSLASFASNRGIIPSSAASANGSDAGTVPTRTRNLVKLPSKSSISDAVASGAPIPPASSSPSSANFPLQQGDTPSNRRTSGQKGDPTQRPQPHRSRSRAQHRFSGSHNTNTHSPASDRSPNQKDKEES